MPQFPESMTIVTKGKALHRLEVDGAEFPWYITDEGIDIDLPDVGPAKVSIALFVDVDRINFKEQTNE